MSIRIIIGKDLVIQRSHVLSNKLEDIYVSQDVVIQGDFGVKTINDKGSACTIFNGNIIGKRQDDGGLSILNKNEEAFADYLSKHSIDDYSKNLEGRYILVKISNANEVDICNDKYGQMDLYYQKIGGGTIFSTELSLLPCSQGGVGYDHVAVAHSLYIYGFRPGKSQTLYSGVKRLNVGEIASWKNGQLSFYRISFNLPYSNNDYGNQELTLYSKILLDAIEKRSSPYGNLVYLSSGWDSTSILAHLVKIHGPSKVNAIIGRMNFSKRRGVINQFELDRAKAFADYYGVQLDVVEYDYWQRGPEFLEQMRPFLKSHMLSGMSVYFWDDLARHVATYHKGKAVFCGEISDGSHNFGFAQYATILNHPDLGFREYADKMGIYLFGPTFLQSLLRGEHNKDIVYKVLKGDLHDECFDKSADNISDCMKQLMASLFLRDKRLPLWSIKNAKIFTEKGSELYSSTMNELYIDNFANEITPQSLYSCYQYLYNFFHWQGGTVSSLAFTANKYGFEMNLPFYDSRIQAFLYQMPESWGRGLELRSPKYPLKWTLSNSIDYPIHLQKGPHSYLYDIDPNFSHAGEFIYQSSFTPFIKAELKKRKYMELLSPELFNLEYYNEIVNNYLEGKEVVAERTDLSSLIFMTMSDWY